jgi:hypothetical protein
MLRIDVREGPIIFIPWKKVVIARKVQITEIINTQIHASRFHPKWRSFVNKPDTTKLRLAAPIT